MVVHLLLLKFSMHNTNQRMLTIGGKYHCMADLLFDWFGLEQTSKTVSNSK